MPLTAKGQKLKGILQKEYGAKKGESVLYAGKNKGTFTGIDAWAKRGQGVAATSPLEIVNDALRSGRLTRAKVRDALRTRDDWSPEARAAAAEARRKHNAIPNSPSQRTPQQNKAALQEILQKEALNRRADWRLARRTKDDDDWDEGRKPNVGRAVLTLGTLRDALRKRRTRDGNFQKLEHSLAHEKGITDPAALAASIGRKKYGAAGMVRKSEAGR